MRSIAALALLLACGFAGAQQGSAPTGAWPVKAGRIMVGASPGGGTDIIARMLAEKYQAAFGQPFVVEKMVPNVVAVAPTVRATNVKELVAEINAQPGGFSCGSSGIGSTQHLACEAFALATGTRIVHIPYKGSAPALVDLVARQIQLDFDTTSSAMSFIRSGKVRALAVMTTNRSAELPDVPTLSEAGVPGVEMYTWYGLFTTAGTPREVQARLYAETMRILAMPEIRDKLRGLGGEAGTLTAEQFGAMNRADYERFGKLVREANIKSE